MHARSSGHWRPTSPRRLEYSLESRQERRFYEACIVRCDSDRLLSIVRDITDRKRAELDAAAQRQELAHLNRVLILAEQSGALAHELSQPLAAILANAQAARRLLDRSPPDLGELRATLDDVIKSGKRAGAVIQRLRELLKKSNTVLQPLDLNEVTREVLDLTRSDLLLRRMPITTALSPGIPPVLGDRVQLQQVILNLVLNACDAMSTVEPAERELTLTTVADDECVQIAIADRGVGIPDGAARLRVRSVRDASGAGTRPGPRDQSFDRSRAPRTNPGREQCRPRRNVPLLPSAGQRPRRNRRRKGETRRHRDS